MERVQHTLPYYTGLVSEMSTKNSMVQVASALLFVLVMCNNCVCTNGDKYIVSLRQTKPLVHPPQELHKSIDHLHNHSHLSSAFGKHIHTSCINININMHTHIHKTPYAIRDR